MPAGKILPEVWEGRPLKVIRSARRSIGLRLRDDGSLEVRAPLRLSDARIGEFLLSRGEWIRKNAAALEKQRRLAGEAGGRLDEAQLRELAAKAADYIPHRVACFAPLVGVSFGRITVRAQRTRWGSCSSRGNLNFNCLLMLAPPEVLDSVVVHELCHRKEMNHSAAFYAEVLRVFPDYRKWNRWLKENGGTLLARLPKKE